MSKSSNIYALCNPTKPMKLQDYFVVFVDTLFDRYDIVEWLLEKYGEPEVRWSIHTIEEDFTRYVIVSFAHEKDITLFRLKWDGNIVIVSEKNYNDSRVRQRIEDDIKEAHSKD